MTLNVVNDHQAIAVQVAQEISEAIKTKNQNDDFFVLGLATGSTMEPLYAELIRLYEAGEVDFSRVKFFNLDNYIGLGVNNRNNYAVQLHKLFLDKVNTNPEYIDLVPSNEAFDLDAYEQRIEAAGGIDIQVLGVGGEGHIGFNEKGSSIQTISRIVSLSTKTLEDNSKFFNKIDPETNTQESIPPTALTRGIAPIMRAKRIICLANGHNKALAVKGMYEEGSVESLPLRVLNYHPNARIIVDKEAIALFNREMLTTHTNLNEPQVEEVLEDNTWHPVTLTIRGKTHTLLLPPQFDFYNPYEPYKMGVNETFDYRNLEHLNALAHCLEATETLTFGAHPDDGEIMGAPFQFQNAKSCITVILTNGAASYNSLNGKYSALTPKELTKMRQDEQRKAAEITQTPVIMCNVPSAGIIEYMGNEVLEGVKTTTQGLFGAMSNLNKVIGHHLLDDHDTHGATAAIQIEGLRTLGEEKLYNITVLSVEVWGDALGAKQRQRIIPIYGEALLAKWEASVGVYVSQILGQDRRYSEDVIYRARGNAGFRTNPYATGTPDGLMLAVDISDLVRQVSLPIYNIVETLMTELFAEKMQLGRKRYNDVRLGLTHRVVPSVVPSSIFTGSNLLAVAAGQEDTIEKKQNFS